MRITGYTIHQVVVPTNLGSVNSEKFGPCPWDRAPKFVIEAHTDIGLVGLSETYRDADPQLLESDLRGLIGCDLTRLCWQELNASDHSVQAALARDDPHRLTHLYERSANHWERIYLEVLIYDLLGRMWQVPMSQLLGGAYRDRVAVDFWMGQMTPDDSAIACRRARDSGYRGAKLKCALGDDLVARAQAIRDACGDDFLLTIDPNQRFWRFGEAIGMLRRLAEVGNIGCVEDPFVQGDDESYRLLRAQGLFPVALHTSLEYGPSLMHAIRAQLCDYINLGYLPADTRKAGDVCWAAGIATWHGSGADLGILEAAYLHVCAATKSMSRPSDILGRAIRRHNLVDLPLAPVDGFVPVPRGGGLGVNLDRDLLDKHTVAQRTLQ